MASLIRRLRDRSASLCVLPSASLRGRGAAVAVLVPDLGDRGHMDGVVDAPVAAQRQPVGLAVPGGHLDRGGAVVGGEVVAAGEPGHGDDVADDGGAMTGPTPNTSVRVVPEAVTAAVSSCGPRRRASRWRMSAEQLGGGAGSAPGPPHG